MYSGLHRSRDWNPGVGSRVCVFNCQAASRPTEGRRFVCSPVTGDRPWLGIRPWASGPLELLTSWPSYLTSPCSPGSTVPLPYMLNYLDAWAHWALRRQSWDLIPGDALMES